jgi:hypothetical protein
VARHRANVLLHCMSGAAWAELEAEQRLETARAFGRVLAAFASFDEASTVNWIESGSIWPAATAKAAADVELPIPFWVRSWRFPQALAGGRPGTGCFTVGLRVFAGREIHFHPIPEAEGEKLVGYCDRLMHYLMVEGPVIKDGDTIEFEPGQKVEVRHGKAPSGVLLYEIRLHQD